MLVRLKERLRETTDYLYQLNGSLVPIFLAISFIITIVWFAGSEFLIYTDTHFPLINIDKYIERLWNILDTGYFPQISDVRHLFLYPYALYFIPFSSVWSQFFASVAQHTFLFLMLSFAFISIYLLLIEINRLGRQRVEPLGVLIASLVYVINIYAAVSIWRTFMPPAMIHYAFFPMFVAFSMRYFASSRKKYLIIILLLSWTILPAYNSPPLLIFDLLFLAAVFVSIKKLYKKSWTRLAINFVTVWLGIFILSIPIIVTTISFPSLLSTQYGRLSTQTYWLGPVAPLLDLIRSNSPPLEKALFYSGFPLFYDQHNFVFFTNHMKPLEPLLLIFTGGLICTGIFVIVKNKTPYMIVYAVFWTFSMFLFTGSNPPFSNLKLAVFLELLKEPFRSVYVRFGEYVVLASIPLIYLGIVSLLSSKIPKLKIDRKIISSFLILAFLISSFPVLDGSFLKRQSGSVPSDQVQIPESYVSLQRLNANDNQDFVYLTIPPGATISQRIWNNGINGYIGPDIFPFILNGRSIGDNEIFKNIMELIVEGKLDQVQRIIPLKYIIVTFDALIERDKINARQYYTLIKEKLNLPLVYYDPQYLAVFKLPEPPLQTTSAANNQIFILNKENQDKEEIAQEIFDNSRRTLIYKSLPVAIEYDLGSNLGRQLSGVIDFNDLSESKVISEVQLKEFGKNTYFFPIYIEFPNITQRLYIAVSRDTNESPWTISTGMWSANSMKWVYSPIYYTSSDQLTFIVDFALNLLTIKQENPLLLKDFSMPLGWRNNISSVSNSSDLALGTIGTYGTSNLTEIAELSLMQIEREHNNDISKPELLTNGTSIVSIKNVSKINPSSFEVSLSAISKPFVLVLADLYDPFWIASVNGKNIPSDPIGGVINGFMINETGQLNINIHYEPQKWFGYGLIITSIILLVYTCYLICSSISISHLFKICGMTFPNARRKIGSKFKEFG